MQLLGGPNVFGTPTSLLYRSNLVRAADAFYPNPTAEADTSACFAVLRNADYGFVHQVLSYERVHSRQQSEESRSLNAYLPSLLNDLVRYGPFYLTPDEMKHRVDAVLEEYYAFLSKAFLNRRDQQFWNYHQRRLEDAGHSLSYLHLTRKLIATVFDLLLNPKATTEKTARRLARRLRVPSGPHHRNNISADPSSHASPTSPH